MFEDGMRVITILSILCIILMSAVFVAAEDEVGGIMPDSMWHFFDRAWESVSLTLTFSDDTRVMKRLDIAQERLDEARYMLGKNDSVGLEKAKELYKESLAAMQTDFIMLSDAKTDEIKELYMEHTISVESFVKSAKQHVESFEYIADLEEFTSSLRVLQKVLPASFGMTCEDGVYINDGTFKGCATCTNDNDCSVGSCVNYACSAPINASTGCEGGEIDGKCVECVSDSDCQGDYTCDNNECSAQEDFPGELIFELLHVPTGGPTDSIIFDHGRGNDIEHLIHLNDIVDIQSAEFDVETDFGHTYFTLSEGASKDVAFGMSEYQFTLHDVNKVDKTVQIGVVALNSTGKYFSPVFVRLYQNLDGIGSGSEIQTYSTNDLRNYIQLNALSDGKDSDTAGLQIQTEDGQDYLLLEEGKHPTISWSSTRSWDIKVEKVSENLVMRC